MRKLHSFGKQTLCVFVLLLLSAAAHAQFLRSSYFMDGSSRLQLNPAWLPSRGYVDVPALGMLNVSAHTNSIGTQDVFDMFDAGDDFWSSASFNDKLKSMNKATVSAATDIISFGFYKGKGFWSFNVGVRADVEGHFPKGLFDFLRDMPESNDEWGNSHFGFNGQSLALNAYAEVGVGYARAIGDRLTVGGKFNFLLGAGNLDLQIDNVRINTENLYDTNGSAELDVDARAEANIKGLDLLTNSDGYVDEVEYNSFGIGGYGAGIDLGATYRLLDNLTVSAAVLDLGFIKWSEGSSLVAEGHTHESYSAAEGNLQDFYDRVSGGDVIDLDLVGLEENAEKKSRTTMLPTTLVLGAEYAFLNNKLSAGILSTTRWGQLNTLSELTLIGTYRPWELLNLSLSYSMLQSAGKSFGLGIKLGPLMLGTDYMYLGKNSRSVNAFIGLSFAIGKSRKETLNL